MSEKRENYIISIFTENYVGLLSRVAGIFTRRHINIEAISASKSEIENVHRYTILICEEESLVKKVTLQIEKQVDILRAFYHHENDTIYQKVALFKFNIAVLDDQDFNQKLMVNNARVHTVEKEFIIVEKVGTDPAIMALFDILKPYNILEFNKSGRIAITKPMKTVQKHIEELHSEHKI